MAKQDETPCVTAPCCIDDRCGGGLGTNADAAEKITTSSSCSIDVVRPPTIDSKDTNCSNGEGSSFNTAQTAIGENESPLAMGTDEVMRGDVIGIQSRQSTMLHSEPMTIIGPPPRTDDGDKSVVDDPLAPSDDDRGGTTNQQLQSNDNGANEANEDTNNIGEPPPHQQHDDHVVKMAAACYDGVAITAGGSPSRSMMEGHPDANIIRKECDSITIGKDEAVNESENPMTRTRLQECPHPENQRPVASSSPLSAVSHLHKVCSIGGPSDAKEAGECDSIIGTYEIVEGPVGILKEAQECSYHQSDNTKTATSPSAASEGDGRLVKDAPGALISDDSFNLSNHQPPTTQTDTTSEDVEEESIPPIESHEEGQTSEDCTIKSTPSGTKGKEDENVDPRTDANHLTGDNPFQQLQNNAVNSNNNEKNNTDDPSPPPAAVKTKSVRFAPTNRMRQFESECAVSSLLQGENECNVDLHNNNNGRRKLLSRRQKRAARFIMRSKMGNADDDDCEALTTGRDSSPSFARSSPQPLYADNAASTQAEPSQRSLMHQPTKKKPIQIALLHSYSHTQILHEAMEFIHRDRDVLLQELLKWCGIFQGARRGGALSSFLTVVPPRIGTRRLLEKYHEKEYLDLLDSTLLKGNESLQPMDDISKDCDTMKSCLSPDDTTEKEEPLKADEEDEGDDSFQIQWSSLLSGEEYMQLPSDEILTKYGLEDDCPYPTTHRAHAFLWKYCLAIAGASWHAASLLTASENQTDVAIHWGGGRHHAHASKAGGFCYISDIVLAIHRLLHGHDRKIDDGMFESIRQDQNFAGKMESIQRNISFRRILYIDIDIHHADAVQAAFYNTDQVLTASFHRHSPGFYPSTSGCSKEKGEVGTRGLGYNLNIPLPAGIGDVQFIEIYRKTIFGLAKAYDPHVVVLCVGADGLEGDELVAGGLQGEVGTGEGWMLSPEGLAECVRIAAAMCSGLNQDEICVMPTGKEQGEDIKTISSSGEDNVKKDEQKRGKRRKLLIFGGGGYTPAQTARTHLLCTAAACEGARPGLLWSELPRDIPSHDYFPRYGPGFELVSDQKKKEIFSSYNSSTSSRKDLSPVKGAAGTTEDIMCQDEVSDSDRQVLKEANRAIELATLYIDRQREKKTPIQKSTFCYDLANEKDDELAWMDGSAHCKNKKRSSNSGGGRRRKKKRTNAVAPQTNQKMS